MTSTVGIDLQSFSIQNVSFASYENVNEIFMCVLFIRNGVLGKLRYVPSVYVIDWLILLRC